MVLTWLSVQFGIEFCRPSRTKTHDMSVSPNEEPIIYVIDDNSDVRDSLQLLFQSVGLKAEVFSSAADFLTMETPERASCLILDVRLPGLSGLDVQSELAKSKSNIPIVFITGHGDIPMCVKAMKSGAVDFLPKPLREEDLLGAVRVALDRDRVRREQDMKRRDHRERWNTLSVREQQIFRFVCLGLSNRRTAEELGISEITVKVYRGNIRKKLGVTSPFDLVQIATVLGISLRR